MPNWRDTVYTPRGDCGNWGTRWSTETVYVYLCRPPKKPSNCSQRCITPRLCANRKFYNEIRKICLTHNILDRLMSTQVDNCKNNWGHLLMRHRMTYALLLGEDVDLVDVDIALPWRFAVHWTTTLD